MTVLVHKLVYVQTSVCRAAVWIVGRRFAIAPVGAILNPVRQRDVKLQVKLSLLARAWL